jgi:hypothetical protein
MYKIKFVNKRSSNSVNFYTATEEFITYRKKNYMETGKLLSMEVHTVENIQSTTMTFKDKEAHLEFISDQEVEKNRIKLMRYNKENNIERNMESINS